MTSPASRPSTLCAAPETPPQTSLSRRHWADSPYCARLLKLHWRSDPPSSAMLFLWQSGRLSGFEATAMKEHLEEPEGRASRLLLRSQGLRAAPGELLWGYAE